MVGGTRRTKRKASSEDEEEADVDAIKREEPEEEKEGEGEEEEAKEGDNDVTATPAPAATFEPPGGKRLRVLEQVAKSPEKTTRQSPRKKAATLKSESPPSPPAAAAAVIPPPAPQPEEDSDDGEEIPEESAESWNKKLVSLLLYKTQYKSLNVSASNDAALRSWVDIQRKLYRRHKKNPESVTRLQKEQLQVLEAIEFPFTLKGALHWDRFYEKLKEYHRKHGRFNSDALLVVFFLLFM